MALPRRGQHLSEAGLTVHPAPVLWGLILPVPLLDPLYQQFCGQGRGRTADLSDFQFKVHLIGVGLHGISLAICTL